MRKNKESAPTVTQRDMIAREIFEVALTTYRPALASHDMDKLWQNRYGLWDSEIENSYAVADKILKKLGAG
jgi:hypothetical protein